MNDTAWAVKHLRHIEIGGEAEHEKAHACEYCQVSPRRTAHGNPTVGPPRERTG
jgi:hypothetical protein